MNKKAHFWGWMLLAISVIWGFGFVLTHNALKVMGPNGLNFGRFLLAVGVIYIAMVVTGRDKQIKLSLKTLHHGAYMGLFLFAAFATQNIGLQYTTASNAGFITGLNLIFVPLICAFWLKERVRNIVWVAVALAIIGTLLLSGGVSGFGYGEVMILLCALFFALQIVYTGAYVKECEPIGLTLVQLSVVSLLSLLCALIWEFDQLSAMPDLLLSGHEDLWLFIVISGSLGSGLAYIAQTIGQQYLDSWRVALIYATEPLFGALAGFLLLNELLAPLAWLGAGLIFVGMLMAELLD